MTQTLSTGHVVAGHYRVVERITRNDVSETYRAEDTEGGQAVAVEVFNVSTTATPRQWDACCDQARDAGRLAGTVFINILDSGRDGPSGGHFLLRRLVSSPSLRQQVSTSGPLAPRQVSELLSLLAPGFDKTDKIDLAHRGLNPDNVFIQEGPSGPSVHVTEFGHAELRSAAPEPLGWSAPDTTARGVRAASTSDTYSLTLIAFYALTGHSFFKNADGAEPNARKLQAEQRARLPLASKRATELAVSIPSALNSVFSRGLALNPSRRFKTARELAQAFAKAIPDGVAPEKEGASRPPRPSRLSVPPPPPSATRASVAPAPPPRPRASRPQSSVRPPPPSQRHSAVPSAPQNAELPPPPVSPPISAPLASSPEPPTASSDAAAVPAALPPVDEAIELTPDEVATDTDEALCTEDQKVASAAPLANALFGASPVAPEATPRPELPTAPVSETPTAAPATLPANGSPRPALDSMEMAAALSPNRKPKKLLFVAGGGIAAIVLIAVLASGSSDESPDESAAVTPTHNPTPPPASPSPASKPTTEKPTEQASDDDSGNDEKDEEKAPEVARVKLVCDPADCDAVRCDGQRVANPAEGVELGPGKHVCVARKRGYLLQREKFSVEEGEPTEITFEMKKPTQPGRARPRRSKPEPVRGKPCNPFVEPC